MSYNPWPLGNLKEEYRRTEPYEIKKKGYWWRDARDIVEIFEQKVAQYTGAPYAVAVDCCSHAIFLCLKYLLKQYNIGEIPEITIPKNTYISVPMEIERAGYRPVFYDCKWEGIYELGNTKIYDAAMRLTKNMYIEGSLMCLSFQIKKRIPIGRGGVILCEDPYAYNWFKLASYDGRDLNTPYDSHDHVKMKGYHYYMTPEDAARGILLMDMIIHTYIRNNVPCVVPDVGGSNNYPDISKIWERLS